MEVASEREEERRNSPESSQSPYLEVFCKTSGKFRRFAAGTAAGFAVHVINRKLDFGDASALHIEAVKEGEEPVTFGPNAILVNYGSGWKLQTVTYEGNCEAVRMQQMSKLFPEVMVFLITSRKSPNFQLKDMNQVNSGINFQYIGKISLVFAFMFLLGGILTFLLENLPAANISATFSE
ncbi:hypothetical protein Cni_G04667 [Canna indica]|uniref:Uncharacterized protein n=1 Tax=Canna indica TaxID=4628 RepID=A0AAQ3JXI4_9LILI|nr:hypothetical protein Cni_G04667 [Canna indica]